MRRVLVVGGALALATIAALAGLALLAASQGQRLLGAASQALGREVSAEEVGIHLGLGIGVSLRGVRVAADPALGAAAAPLVSAERVEMRMQLLPLVRRQVIVDRVVVEGPTVTVVRDRSGRLNVGTFGPAPSTGRTTGAAAGGAPPAPVPAPAAAAVSLPAGLPAFQVASLRVRNGVLRYRDDVEGRTAEILDMSADGRQPRLDAPMPVSFRGRLVSTDVALDQISGTGVLDLSANPITYRGTVEGGPGRLAQIGIERLSARLEARPPVLTVEESRVDLLGGRLVGSAQIGAAGRGLVAKVAAESLDLAELPHRDARPHPAGILALSGEVAGPSPANPAFRLALAGTGRFAVQDGRVANLTIGRTVRDLLKVLLTDEAADRLRVRYPELFGGDELRFTKLEGSGRLAQGRLRTEDLIVAAPSYEMRGEGSLGLDGELDLVLRLATSPALTEDLIGSAKVRKLIADTSGRLIVPLRVTGTVDHPRVLPDPRFAAGVASAMLGSAELGEAASGFLDRLLKPRKRGRR